MKKAIDALYSVAVCLIFGTALCADGLADVTGGWAIMFGSIGFAGALIFGANKLEDYYGGGKRR